MNRCSIARVCPACGKVHNYPNKQGYCEKHAMQLKRFGKLLDSNSRSIYDPNEYRVEGNTTYIYVYDKRGNKLPQEIIIDTEDLSKLIQYKIFLQHKSKGNLYYGMFNIERNKKIAIPARLPKYATIAKDERIENISSGTYVVTSDGTINGTYVGIITI